MDDAGISKKARLPACYYLEISKAHRFKSAAHVVDVEAELSLRQPLTLDRFIFFSCLCFGENVGRV